MSVEEAISPEETDVFVVMIVALSRSRQNTPRFEGMFWISIVEARNTSMMAGIWEQICSQSVYLTYIRSPCEATQSMPSRLWVGRLVSQGHRKQPILLTPAIFFSVLSN